METLVGEIGLKESNKNFKRELIPKPNNQECQPNNENNMPTILRLGPIKS